MDIIHNIIKLMKIDIPEYILIYILRVHIITLYGKPIESEFIIVNWGKIANYIIKSKEISQIMCGWEYFHIFRTRSVPQFLDYLK